MGKNPKFWDRAPFGLFDVWVVSAFKSRFVFGSSSVNVGFWVQFDLISSSVHLLWIN